MSPCRGGAVGVEHFTDSDLNSLHYNMWTALEEGMEMTGVIVFMYAGSTTCAGQRTEWSESRSVSKTSPGEVDGTLL